VRSSATVALGRLGDKRAVDPLIVALSDPDPAVRTGAALSLGELGEKKAIEPLDKLLAAEKNENVREQVEIAIKQLKTSPANKP
jgi:HEAT repeat protein